MGNDRVVPTNGVVAIASLRRNHSDGLAALAEELFREFP